jgi:ABC-type nickel/cobalt efflux system permease component RcnA
MASLLSIIALGFLIGMRHATDPDHIIAVSTIVSRERSTWHGALIGAIWGLGHSLTILVVGGGIILLKWVIPTALSLSMELCVGIMLILLGVWNVAAPWPRRSQDSQRKIRRGHSHVENEHTYAVHTDGVLTLQNTWAAASPNYSSRSSGGLSLYQLLRPLIVGVVHGLAGSSTVALLVLVTINNERWAMLYLGTFALGTVAGMMLITSAIAFPFARKEKSPQIDFRFRMAAGIISIGFGVFMVHQIISANEFLSLAP